MLKIEEPAEHLFDKARIGLLEIKDHPTPFDIFAAKKGAEYALKNFEGYLDFVRQSQSENQPKGWVPSTTFWLFDDEKFVGAFDVRHYLTEHLRQVGGHIAYEVVPSERGKGYVLRGLRLILDWCLKNLNLEEVLLYCDEENIASHRVLEKALAQFGGRRLPHHEADGVVECGYWLKTKA